MKSSTSWIIITLVTILVIGGIVVLTGKQAKPYSEFATCLEESGAVFHGAWWCPHCASQKALFKGGKKDLPYNECSNSDKSTKQACADLNIGIEGGTGFPTWQFAGDRFEAGAKTLQELSEATGCELPEEIAGEELEVGAAASRAPELN
jgi:hypothetical protein